MDTNYDIQKYNKTYYNKSQVEIKIQHKKYYNLNKEQILKRCAVYRTNNKDKLQETYTCDCGSIIRITNKSRHMKSIKHLNNNKTI